MPTDSPISTNWRTRPVFISSTFKDMQAERDYLRHVVFPRLEEELRKGRLLLEPIDLRQGVETAELVTEEARELFVLKVCLEEIQRSRPFLIVLLGDRYGWVPPEERMGAATQEVGFQTDVRSKSVTALEIEYGILQESPDQPRRSFFYFRDPLPYERMPQKVAATFSDEYSTDPQIRAGHARLRKLKESLAGDPELAPRIHTYRADWDSSQATVTGLEAWGEAVFTHLFQELSAELSAAAREPPLTWEAQERGALVEFVEHRRRDFAGRRELLNQLQALATSPSSGTLALSSGLAWGACVTGSPGSGKSALFAELFSRLAGDATVLLLANAAGATPHGSRVEAMQERFVLELADALSIANPLPSGASIDDLDATFAALLAQVATQRRVVVLLDALDQFVPTPRGQNLTWLRPKQWPANARLIATALAGPSAEALSQWVGIEELEVPPLTIADDETDDVTEIARSVWQRYHRQISPGILRVLKQKHLADGSWAAGNPLWLTLALEQLNLLDADDFARAEREYTGSPAERQRAMLLDVAERLPPGVTELYQLLLGQSEKLYGAAAARSFAAVIAVSRFGWRESDLFSLIPAVARVLAPDESIPELNDLRLAVLRRSFRAHLVRHGELGQLDFFHTQMRQAIQTNVLRHPDQTQAIHRVVAGFLESLPAGDPIRGSELMVHLIAGDDPHRAARVYSELSMESAALAAATQTLAQHVLAGAKNEPNLNAFWVRDLLTIASPVPRKLERGRESAPLCESDRTLSDQQIAILCNHFNFGLFDALAGAASLGTRELLQGAVQSVLEQLTTADPQNPTLLRELEASCERLGVLAQAQGNLTKARQLYGEVLRVAKDLVDVDPANVMVQRDLSVPLSRLGELAVAEGDLPEAERLFGESLIVTRKLAESDPSNLLWQRDLATAYNHLSNLAKDRGNLINAKSLLTECHRILQELAECEPANVARQRDLAASLTGFGDLALIQGDLREARQAYHDGLQILQRVVEANPAHVAWRSELASSLIQLGNLNRVQGQLSESQRLLSDAAEILQGLVANDPENSAWHRELTVAYGYLGLLAETQGNLSEARRLFTDSIQIQRAFITDHSDTATWQRGLRFSLTKLADLASAQGNLLEAERCCREALRIAQRLAQSDADDTTSQSDLSASLYAMGEVAKARGDLREARQLYQESLDIRRRLTASDPSNFLWQKDLWRALTRISDLFRAQGDLHQVQLFIGEALRIQRRLSQIDPSNLIVQADLWASLINAADLAKTMGNATEGYRLVSEALAIVQRRVAFDPDQIATKRDLAISWIRLGDLAAAQGNRPDAKRNFAQALPVLRGLVETDPANSEWRRHLSIALHLLGDSARIEGNYEEARQHYSECHCIAEKLAESNPANADWRRDLALSWDKLGDLAFDEGKLAEAEHHFGEALGITRQLVEFDPKNTAWQYDLLVSARKMGGIAIQQGNLVEALRLTGQYHRMAVQLSETDGANSLWQRELWQALIRLGILAKGQRDFGKALQYVGEALRVAQRRSDADPGNGIARIDLATTLGQAADVLGQSGSPEAIGYWQKAYAVMTNLVSSGIPLTAQDTQCLEFFRSKTNS